MSGIQCLALVKPCAVVYVCVICFLVDIFLKLMAKNVCDMKCVSLTAVILFSILGFCFQANCQAVFNGGFEEWVSVGNPEVDNGKYVPKYWSNSAGFGFAGGQVHPGTMNNSRAVNLQIRYGGFPNETMMMYGQEGEFPSSEKGMIHAGHPFAFRPDTLYGDYLFWSDLTNAEHFDVHVLLKKWNVATNQVDTIAYAKGELTPTGYQTQEVNGFSLPLNYYGNETPDSLVIAFVVYSDNPEVGDSTPYFGIDNVRFSKAVNIDDAKGDVGLLHIFPNPATERIHLQLASDIKELNVYNALGQKVFEGKGLTNKYSIAVEDWVEGVYYLQLLSNEGYERLKKFVVKH